MTNPDKVTRPNYVSFNEASFILTVAGVDVLKQTIQSGLSGVTLRDKFRAMMQDSDADHP